MIGRVPFPNCRGGVIGLAIAGNPENDGHLSPWQEAVEAVRHEIILDRPRISGSFYLKREVDVPSRCVAIRADLVMGLLNKRPRLGSR